MNYGTMGTLLTKLKIDGPIMPDVGICTNLLEVADKHLSKAEYEHGNDSCVLSVLAVIFSNIGLDGGDPFPIQHPGGLESGEAYSAARCGGMWSTTEPYGQARWKVLDDAIAFCAAQPQDGEIS